MAAFRRSIPCLTAFLVMTLAGCGSNSAMETSSERTADQHASTAGSVMARDPTERSANDAAAAVVGTVGNVMISAAVADGTTYNGRIVLRIDVTSSGNFGDSGSTRCYSYSFHHTLSDGQPTNVTCPDTTVAILTPPPPPDLRNATELAKFRDLLDGLTGAQLRDANAVQRLLANAFPPPTYVYAEVAPNGTLEAGARTTSTCVTGTASAPHQVTVTSAAGPSCQP